MADPSIGSAVGAAVGVTAILTAIPFGVPLEILVLGGVCYFGGSCARTGLALYKKLDSTVDPVNLGRAIAALLCTIPVAAVASGIVFLGAHVIGLNADAALGGLLLVMGLRGPESLTFLADTFSNVFTKVLPGKSGGTGS